MVSVNIFIKKKKFEFIKKMESVNRPMMFIAGGKEFVVKWEGIIYGIPSQALGDEKQSGSVDLPLSIAIFHPTGELSLCLCIWSIRIQPLKTSSFIFLLIIYNSLEIV